MSRYSRIVLFNAALAVFVLTGIALRGPVAAQEKAKKAQQPPKQAAAETQPATQNSADLAAIDASADALTEAFDKGDAKAIAALFTPEAEYVDGFGRVFHGRDDIEAVFADGFKANPGAKIVINMDSVRLVSAGILVEEGTSRVSEADDGPVTQSHCVILHARQPDGKWLMASARTTRDVPITPHERLKALAWLVGRWVDESPDSVVETTWRWSDDGNYLLGDFDIQVRSTVMMKGTQRLGWDAARKQIRSWVFDSEGGFTQGLWTATEDGWIVKATGISADGDAASSTNVYTRVSDEAFDWVSRDRVTGGDLLPDVEVKVVRAPPEPEAK